MNSEDEFLHLIAERECMAPDEREKYDQKNLAYVTHLTDQIRTDLREHMATLLMIYIAVPQNDNEKRLVRTCVFYVLAEMVLSADDDDAE